MIFIASMRSRITFHRLLGFVPWISVSSRFKTSADPEQNMFIRKIMKRGYFLSKYDRITLNNETDACADEKVICGSNRESECNEQIEVASICLTDIIAIRKFAIRLVGICVCFANNDDSNPNASAVLANSSGFMSKPAGKVLIPNFRWLTCSFVW